MPGQRDIKPGATVARLSSLTIRNKYEAIERELGMNTSKADMMRLLKKRETSQDPQLEIQLAEAEAKVKSLTFQKNDLIAQYNLQSRFKSIDIGFLLDMPDRVLPTLVARRGSEVSTSQMTPSTSRLTSSGLPSASSRPACNRPMRLQRSASSR